MSSGSPETLVLNTSKLVWSLVTSVQERDPLASEVIHSSDKFVKLNIMR